MRGFFRRRCRGISKPMNLGNLIRSAHAFGASFVFLVKADFAVRTARSDTSQAEHQLRSTISLRPRRCSCRAAVGWSAASWWTTRSICPASAIRSTRAYVFGPERSSLSPVLARCHHVVRIPTRFCINTAVAGAVVMYDRILSWGASRRAPACRRADRGCRRMSTGRSAGSPAAPWPEAKGREAGVRSFHWRGERLWCADFHPGSKRQGDQCDTRCVGP